MEVSVPGVPIDSGVATSEVLVEREHNPKSDGDGDLESERVSITKTKKQREASRNECRIMRGGLLPTARDTGQSLL